MAQVLNMQIPGRGYVLSPRGYNYDRPGDWISDQGLRMPAGGWADYLSWERLTRPQSKAPECFTDQAATHAVAQGLIKVGFKLHDSHGDVADDAGVIYLAEDVAEAMIFLLGALREPDEHDQAFRVALEGWRGRHVPAFVAAEGAAP